MTDFALAVILLLLLALAGVMAAWSRAEERADRAERNTDAAERQTKRAEDAARRILRGALASPHADVRRNAREIQQFAGLPRHPARITDVDQFIHDVFGGR